MELKDSIKPVSINIDWDENIYISAAFPNGDVIDLLPREYQFGIPATYAIVNGNEAVCFGRSVSSKYSHRHILLADLGQPSKVLTFDDRQVNVMEAFTKILSRVLEIANQNLYVIAGTRTNLINLTYTSDMPIDWVTSYKQAVENMEIALDGGSKAHAKVDIVVSREQAAALYYMKKAGITQGAFRAVALSLDRSLEVTLLSVMRGVSLKRFAGSNCFATEAHAGSGSVSKSAFIKRMENLIIGRLGDKYRDDGIVAQSMSVSAEAMIRDLKRSDSALSLGIMSVTGPVNPIEITRDEFAQICRGKGAYVAAGTKSEAADLIGAATDMVRNIYAESLREGFVINKILLIGEMANMRMVKDALREAFRAELASDSEFIVPLDDEKAPCFGLGYCR